MPDAMWLRYAAAGLILWLPAAAWLMADDFERPPIDYSQSEPDNAVAALQQQLESGRLRLEHRGQFGYLPDLLEALGVPVESQTLVFSKTSLQQHRISPRTPRALYFNDEVYVGYCHEGDVLEVTAVDPKLGAVFYTLDQTNSQKIELLRQTDSCTLCHASSRTDDVPGHVLRSLFVDVGGRPIFSAGSRSVDQTTPIADRWGGWYVTGEHGDQKHLGNLVIRGRDVPRPVDNADGHNVTDLSDRFAVKNYLSPHSDLVALMVLEHQATAHNRLTKAGYTARQALHYQTELNRALGEPPGRPIESTTRRIENAGDALVDYLLFVEEAEIASPLSGTSGYAEWFEQLGPHDSQGRSLRDLDLKQRVFKYPLSYLVYSKAFDELPPQMSQYVYRRLWHILSGRETSDKYAHLSPDDRQAILEIVRDTKPNLPDYWRQ